MTLATTAVAIPPFQRVINHVVELIVAGCLLYDNPMNVFCCPFLKSFLALAPQQCVASFVCVTVKFNLCKCFEINSSGHFGFPILLTLM